MVSLVLAGVAANAQTLPYSENFSDTTYEDAVETTAAWVPGGLRLPTGVPLTGSLSGTTPVELILSTFETRAIALADMDGDGDLDLIDAGSGRNGVQLNNGNGFFGGRTITPNPGATNTRSVATGDVNRDGYIDFVTANFIGRSRVYINVGTTGKAFLIYDISNQNRQATSIALADLDGDGFLDAIQGNTASQENLLFINTRDPLTPFGASGSAGVILGSVAEDTRHIVTGDLDNDNDIDIVFLNGSSGNQLNRVLMNNGGNPLTFTESAIGVSPADIGDSRHGALGDLNDDGFLDLVVVNEQDGEASKIYFNDGSGTQDSSPFTIAATDFTVVGPPTTPVGASGVSLADPDNDGDLDILLVNSSTDFRNSVYVNDGTGSFGAAVFVGTSGQDGLVLTEGAVSTSSAVGDINGDGALDWVIGNQVAAPSGPQQNMSFDNEAIAGAGTPQQQLTAHATSLPIDSTTTVTSVKLSPSPSTTAVGARFHNDVEYWVTGNASSEIWTRIMPDGRPVAIVGTTGVRWRADLKANSPFRATSLSLDQLDIINNLTGPVVATGYPDTRVNQGDDTTGLPISGSITDTDGDTVYYTVTGLPTGTGLSIDTLTGDISGTPTLADVTASPVTVTVAATDGAIVATDDFTLTALNAHFTSTPVTAATEDVAYTYNITAADPDLDALNILAPTLPAWLTFTDNGDGTASLVGTPTVAEVGDHPVSLQVTDGGFTDTQDFTITVASVNDAPVFTSTPLTAATEDTAYSYTATTTDPDLDAVAITAPTLPAWLTFTDNGDGTATLTGMPAGAEVGDHAVQLLANDGTAAPVQQDFTITVVAAADAPTITLNGNASVSIVEGTAYTDAGATASDPQDGDLTAQIVVDNPVDSDTPGTYTVTYTVQDSAGNQAQAQRTVTVTAAPPPPPPPPPPPSGGGGGSLGFAELLVFGLALLGVGTRRRRTRRVR